MGKAYKKVVKFLNDYNVDESKALKTLKIYSKKQTSYMGRNINISQEKRARNFADMVRKEKRKKYPGVMRFKLKK